MAFCKKCGSDLENSQYCSVCSRDISDNDNLPYFYNGNDYGRDGGPYERPGYTGNSEALSKRKNDITGMLVWSVINTLPFCNPLGIAALIFVIRAKAAAPAEVRSCLKTARIINIIATSLSLLFFIAWMVTLSL